MDMHAEITYDKLEVDEDYEKFIKNIVEECFKNEKLDKLNLYITITLTVPEKIREINKKYRNIDKETDVLSFPMFEKEEIIKLIDENYEVEDVLGDLVISIPRVREQAKEYGHSFDRELAYMIVHGFYHLMGYDHEKDEDKKLMRAKEDEILNKLHITREN